MKYFTLTTNEGSSIGIIAAENLDQFLKLSNEAIESHYDEAGSLSFNSLTTFTDLCNGKPKDINIHLEDSNDIGQVDMTWLYQS